MKPEINNAYRACFWPEDKTKGGFNLESDGLTFKLTTCPSGRCYTDLQELLTELTEIKLAAERMSFSSEHCKA